MSKRASMWDKVDAVRVDAGIGDSQAPEGAFTAAEYRAQFKVNNSTSFQQLQRLVQQGRLKSGVRVAKDSAGRRRPTKVYWPA